MNFLLTSDLHGHWPHYESLLKLTEKNGLDALFLGGDLFPRQGHDQHSLSGQIDFIKDRFIGFLERLCKINDTTKVFIIAGNNDWAESFKFIELQEIPNLTLLPHDQYVQWQGVQLLGYPYVPPTPFLPKDYEKKEFPEESLPARPDSACYSVPNAIESMPVDSFFNQRNTIRDDLNGLRKTKSEKPVIAIMHAPPFRTALDRNSGMTPLGSQAIRAWIEQTGPLLTFHGHIHESPMASGRWWEKIGSTLSLCAGQTPEKLFAILLDSADITQARHTEFGPLNMD